MTRAVRVPPWTLTLLGLFLALLLLLRLQFAQGELRVSARSANNLESRSSSSFPLALFKTDLVDINFTFNCLTITENIAIFAFFKSYFN